MAWNVFKFCTALRGLGSIMILLVLGVVVVTYYAVVVVNYGPSLYAAGGGGVDSFTAFAVLILFHLLVFTRQPSSSIHDKFPFSFRRSSSLWGLSRNRFCNF